MRVSLAWYVGRFTLAAATAAEVFEEMGLWFLSLRRLLPVRMLFSSSVACSIDTYTTLVMVKQ